MSGVPMNCAACGGPLDDSVLCSDCQSEELACDNCKRLWAALVNACAQGGVNREIARDDALTQAEQVGAEVPEGG